MPEQLYQRIIINLYTLYWYIIQLIYSKQYNIPLIHNRNRTRIHYKFVIFIYELYEIEKRLKFERKQN